VIAERIPTIADLPRQAKRASLVDLFKGSAEPLVYFLLLGEECVYVGQSIRLLARMNAHARAGKSFDGVYILHVPRSKLDLTERFWIRRLSPTLNVVAYRDLVKTPKKPGPKLATESERKIVLPAGVPAGLVAKLDQWRESHGLNRSQAVTEAIRRLVG
jgi:hypothetical protein